MKKENIVVEKIVNGGFGLARGSSGQVLLIPGSLPGEDLIVNAAEEKKNYSFATLKQILTPHEKRRTPPCRWLAKGCGGCNLQHAEYGLQLELKDAVLSDLLHRQSPELMAEVETGRRPILAAPEEFGYRQRLRLAVQDGRPGFRRSRSHEIVEIDSCMLAPPALNEVLAGLRTHGRQLLEMCSEVELLADPHTHEVVILLHFQRPPRPGDRKAALKLVETLPQVTRLFFCGENFALQGASGEESRQLGYSYAPSSLTPALNFSFEIGGFCQVNLAQNQRLIETALEFASLQPEERVLDLFCGMGNFSLPMALQGAGILGIEGQGSAIRSAKRNTDAARVAAEFRKTPVHTACAELSAAGDRFDLILIDPPREGAPDLAPILATLAPRLVYISCDPATLMRDLTALRSHGFHITAMQPVDMFPQTHHLEVVTLLCRD